MTDLRAQKRAGRFWSLFPLIWLIWLVYPIQAFMDRAYPWPEAVLFWLILLGFVGLYARAFMSDELDDRWAYGGWVAALVLWGIGLKLYGPSTFTFLIYGAALIGWQRRLGLTLLGAAINLLLMVGTLLMQHGEVADLLFAIFIPVSAYANHATYTALTARRKLAKVQLEKEKLAADAERERIARDLHDLLGHTLSVIVLKSELAGKLAEKNPARAAQEIREVERISREALQEVRAAVSGYRGSGFAAELARAKVALDAAGIKLTMLDTLPPLSPAAEATGAMLLREAVTNVVRHAGASEVSVSFAAVPGGQTLTIHDNGKGGSAPEGTGLNSMRERLRAIGGTLERDGKNGTKLVAFFPAESAAPQASGVEALRA